MKKNLAKKVTLSILAGAVLMSSSVVWARDITDIAPSAADPWKKGTINGGSDLYAPRIEGADTFSSAGNSVLFTSTYTESMEGLFAGGYAENGDVTNNSFTVNGGYFGMIHGGRSELGDVTNNKVAISGGKTDKDSKSSLVYGGYSTEGNVKNNVVTLDAEEIDYQLAMNAYGGYTKVGEVTKNKITISGGKIGYSIYGGYSEKGAATYNNVTVRDSKITQNVYGGYSGEGSADNNKVDIINSKAALVYGGHTVKGNANGNNVTVSDSNITRVVSGGSTKEGNANGNNVIVSNSTKTQNVYGGTSENGNATNNTVTINGGEITGAVYGGSSANGNASDNTVTINGGKLGEAVFGGSVTSNGNAINNTINIASDADLADTQIYGGNVSGNRVKSGNVLNVGYDEGTECKSWINGRSVEIIGGFEEINFNNVVWEKDATVLVVKNDIDFDDTNIDVVSMINDSGEKPAVGDEMTLIKLDVNTQGSISGNEYNSASSFKVGSFLKADGKIYSTDDGKNINLEIIKVSSNGQALVIGESRAAATAFTNQGSELVETGLDALARDNEKDTKVFAALYGNASEFATGSHVKVNGWSGIVGVGETNADGLTVGAFFENGEGNYRTYNTVDGDFMRGDGEACYNGGGFLVRKDNADGVYTEASLRAGNLQNELRNAVLAGDKLAGYDIDTFYYGAHIGIGKVIPRGNDGDSIDVYGKFIYTHHDSENFKIDGDEFHFDSVDSERLRLGFRINEVQTNKLAMYYGAAWEYEFGGDADNTVVGYDLSTPSLGGSTVIGEIGAHYKASDKWSFDLNGRAYVGQREGFSGSVQANYAF